MLWQCKLNVTQMLRKCYGNVMGVCGSKQREEYISRRRRMQLDFKGGIALHKKSLPYNVSKPFTFEFILLRSWLNVS